MLNDLAFSVGVSALILTTIISGLLAYLCQYLYVERIKWMKRYIELFKQFEDFQQQIKDAAVFLTPQQFNSVKSQLQQTTKDNDNTTPTAVMDPFKKPDPSDYN